VGFGLTSEAKKAQRAQNAKHATPSPFATSLPALNQLWFTQYGNTTTMNSYAKSNCRYSC
jgi:hypothetical protein